jgi:very-short-patch-repair endonuclease
VTTADLLACGLSPKGISHRVARGRLHRLHRGVYAVGDLALPSLAPFAAVLATCGVNAVLSHWSAARVWRLIEGGEGGDVHVVMACGQARRRPGLVVHRTLSLADSDVERHRGLRVTSVARTLRDLAPRTPLTRLERLVAEALRSQLVTVGELDEVPKLRRIVEGGAQLTRSEAERRLLRLVRRAGIPLPQTNVRVAGFEVDAYWPAHRLVVEVDGFAFHGDRVAFERDRMKGLALQRAGVTLVRVSPRLIDRQPEQVVATIVGSFRHDGSDGRAEV